MRLFTIHAPSGPVYRKVTLWQLATVMEYAEVFDITAEEFDKIADMKVGESWSQDGYRLERTA